MNPQHTIPVLKDGDFCLSESKAIAAYIASKFDKSGKMYPEDAVIRSKVDQRIYFHETTFYGRFAEVIVSFLAVNSYIAYCY